MDQQTQKAVIELLTRGVNALETIAANLEDLYALQLSALDRDEDDTDEESDNDEVEE